MIKWLPVAAFTLAFGCCSSAQAQKGKTHFTDPNENFYDTQKRMNKKFRKHEREMERERKAHAGKEMEGENEEQELGGYELYKRWEYYMEPRVYPSGDIRQAHRAVEEYQAWRMQNAQSRQGQNTVQSSTWQPLGPFGDPTGGNAGRINAVRFDPSNTSGLWICTPDGGMWNSANNGSSWTTNTDQLSPIGNSDVVFDPTNSQVMYLATGDGDHGDSYSVGVLKSTNGGATWNTTGLSWTTSQYRLIYKMIINPQNKNVILVASNIGVYRTTNGGTTWASVSAGAYTDIVYKPGDTTTVYATSTSLYGGSAGFYKSTNGGASFSTVTSGLPATGTCDRLSIAVTPANANYVYVVGSDASNDGFYGFYQSTNSGTSFVAKATSTPNLLGWASAGNDTGGQGWYTLSIAANPTNANEVVVGGVNTWKTTNGGTNWTLFTHWTGSGAPYIHADCHNLIYKNGTTVYAGTDGGIFTTSNGGTSWASINGNMNIAQMYKMGNSTNTYSLAISGHQDNGTNIYNGGWAQTMGGDGMSAFIDWSNDQVMYGEQYQGSFNRTTNGGGAWTAITSGTSGTGAWNTPWHQDPQTANTLYGGFQQLFKSTNQGTSWSAISSFGNSTSIVEFAVAPSNPQVIYVIQGGTMLYKTTNGGASWADVTGTLPVSSAKMTFVTVKNNDPNSVWITFSGYSSGNKVYTSSNGGTSWTNYSTGLPNIPVNCITYWNNTKQGLYIGCDIGIYYRDSLMSSWTSYNTGLPNVAVHDLAIFYPLGKIRAATFGRGMWEADLYNNGTMAPVANFTADKTFICAGTTVNFTDLSSFAPTSWSWTFQSGTPATSTVQNPSIVYNTPGTYSVTLTATNANGSNTASKTSYITVSPVNTLPLAEGFEGATFPPVNWQNYDAGNDGLVWKRNASVGKNSTASMYYDNYNQNAAGTRDEMRAPKYNFSGFSTIKLYFDVAYSQYDATYSDSLAVMISTDCGSTFSQVYLKGGATLATAPNYTAAIFTPTSTQWRTDTVYLNSYAGQSNVMVSFQNRGHFGQAIYVDNVNISGSGTGAAPVAAYSVPAVKCTGQSITFTDQSTNNPTSWSWTFSGGTPATSTLKNPVVTFSSPGTHTVTLTATNSFGTSSPSTQTVNIVATPTVTSVASPTVVCAGQSATLTGGGASTYTWSANAGSATTSTVSVSPATATVYTLTGASSGCSNTSTVSVAVNPSPTITVNNSTICSGASATLTAAGGTTYLWSTGATTSSVSVSPGATTVYTVTGTSGGCSSSKTATVTVNATPTVTVNSAAICAGSAATLTASGATTYSWNTSATTNTISVSPSGTTTYTVTGTSGGCSNSSTATVTVTPSPTITVNTATVCAGSAATLTASGATSYSWSTSATTNTISVSPSNTTAYTVTGTSAGCSSNQTTTVTAIPLPTVTVNNASICAGASATLTAAGATSYSWNTGAGTASINVSPASTSTYVVIGTSSGCNSNPVTATVTVNATPTVTASSSSASVCQGQSVTLTGGGASTYTWSANAGSANTSTVSVSPSANAMYTVTGANGGCSNTATVSISVTAAPSLTVTAAQTSICNGQSATLSGSGATNYTWSANAGSVNTSTVTVSPSASTTYTLTGDNGGTCAGSATISITVNATPTVSASSASVCSGSSTSLNASGASSYTWMPGGQTGASIVVTPTANATYTVTGANGTCTNTATSSITVLASPVITATAVQDTICNGNSTGITASGGVSYTWSPPAGLNTTSGANVTANPTVTTTYTVSGSGSNGCSNSVVIKIIVNGCTGIQAVAQQTIDVYPNPNNGSFVVEIPFGKEIYNMEIRNALGQLVYSDKLRGNISSKQHTLSLQDAEKGVYTFLIWNEQTKLARKIVIE